MIYAHEQLATSTWRNYSLTEQMGNIGSEVGRAIKRQQLGDDVQRDRALDRALELFDLTLADERWHGRRREVARAREAVCAFFYGDNMYHDTAEALEKYFMHFALAARRGK